MSRTPTDATVSAAGAWWRAALVLAWVAGTALQLQQPALWADEAYPLLLAAALAAAWFVLRRGRSRHGAAALVLALAAAAAAGFALAGWRAQVRLADALAPEWEGRDLELEGVVDGMPQVADDGEHFAFVIDSARALPMSAQQKKRLAGFAAADGRPMTAAALASIATRPRGDAAEPDDAPPAALPGAPPRVPSRVWLAWDRDPRDDRAVAGGPGALAAAQRWRLPVRLRLPHGALNPDGFDAELWLFDQNLRATGTVRGGGVLLASGWAPIEHARQWVRDRLLLRGADAGVGAQAAGALAALAVGDQAAVCFSAIELVAETARSVPSCNDFFDLSLRLRPGNGDFSRSPVVGTVSGKWEVPATYETSRPQHFMPRLRLSERRPQHPVKVSCAQMLSGHPAQPASLLWVASAVLLRPRSSATRAGPASNRVTQSSLALRRLNPRACVPG